MHKTMLAATWLLASVVAVGCSGSQEPTEQPVAMSEAPAHADAALNVQPPPVSETTAGEKGSTSDGAKATKPLPEPQGAPPSWMAKPQEPYRAGEVLKYLPKDCKERFYLDVATALGADTADLQHTIDQFLAADLGRGSSEKTKRIDKALKMMREAGADPVSSIREIAYCHPDAGGEVFAVGASTGKPVEIAILIQKVSAALDEGPGTVIRTGDVSTYAESGGNEVFMQPGPQVFLVGRKETVAPAVEAKSGASGFAGAKGHLLFIKSADADGSVNEKGKNIELDITVHMKGSRGDKMKKDSASVTGEMSEQRNHVAGALKGTALEPFADRLRAMKFTARGKDILISGSIPRETIVSVAQSVRAADVEKLIHKLDK